MYTILKHTSVFTNRKIFLKPFNLICRINNLIAMFMSRKEKKCQENSSIMKVPS